MTGIPSQFSEFNGDASALAPKTYVEPTTDQDGMALLSQAFEKEQEFRYQNAAANLAKTFDSDPHAIAFKRQYQAQGGGPVPDAKMMQRFAELRSLDLDSIQKNSPVLFSRLEQQESAALIRKDLEKYSTVERWFGSSKRGWLESDLSKLEFKKTYVSWNPEDQTEYDQLKKELDQLPSGRGEWMTSAFKIGGQIANQLPGALAAGVAGAGAGLLAGPGGAAAGFGIGFKSGFALQSFATITGDAVSTMREGGYDPQAIKVTAPLVGVAGTALEMVGLKLSGNLIKGAVVRHMSNSTVAKLGLDTTLQALLATPGVGRAAGRYGLSVAGETGTEVLEEISLVLAENLAQKISREEFQVAISDYKAANTLGKRIAEIAEETFKGVSVLGLPAFLMDAKTSRSRHTAAQQRAQGIKAILDYASGTVVNEADPGVHEDIIQEIGENSQLSQVILNSKQFSEAVQAFEERLRKSDPSVRPGSGMEAFRKAFPEIAAQFDQVSKNGGEIRIDIADIAKMAKGEGGMHADILQRGRIVGPEMDNDLGLSWEEAQKQFLIAEQLRLSANRVQLRRGKDFGESRRQIVEDVKKKLAVVEQYSPRQRSALAELAADYYTVRADRFTEAGTVMTPMDAYRSANFKVKGTRKVEFAEKPTPVTTEAQQETAAAKPEGEPAAEPETTIITKPKAPESLTYMVTATEKAAVDDLVTELEGKVSDQMSASAATRQDELTQLKRQQEKLQQTMDAEAAKVRAMSFDEYVEHLMDSLSVIEKKLESMDPKDPQYDATVSWSKYANKWLDDNAKQPEPQAEQPMQEAAPLQDAVLPSQQEIVEAVQTIAEAEAEQQAEVEPQPVIEQAPEAVPAEEGKPTFFREAWSRVPGKGDPESLQTGFISGKHNDKIAARASERGDIGLLVTPLNPNQLKHAGKYPFIGIDNGVFSQTTPFSPDKFRNLVIKVSQDLEAKKRTLFVVAPDVVGDAAKTLAQFSEWADWIHSQDLPVALAAQDGLENMMDQIPWEKVDVLFIGGSTKWKVGDLPTQQERAQLSNLYGKAQELKIPIHMGRVNTNKRIAGAAQNVGASTVDGTTLAIAPDKNLPKVEAMLDKLNVKQQNLDAQNFPELGRAPTTQELYDIASDDDIASVSDLGAYEPALKQINAIRAELNKPLLEKTKVAKAKKVIQSVGKNEQLSELQQAARDLFAGKITRDQWDTMVAKLRPMSRFENVPELSKVSDIKNLSKLALKAGPTEDIPNGTRVALRLDIPAWRDHKIWAVSVHKATPQDSANPKEIIAYTNAIAISNVTFASNERKAGLVATKQDRKDVLSVVNGDKLPMSAEEVHAMAKQVMNDPEWIQVGFNPEIHSYFWDRQTMQPVVAADSVLQVGPLVLAKNPKFEDKSKFRYSRATDQSEQDAAYLAAVEAGDMETAQQMVDEAAKSAGYQYFGYHASHENFNEFLSLAEQAESRGEYFEYEGYDGGNIGRGFYFTPDVAYARRFGTPRKFYLKIENIVDSRNDSVKERLKTIYQEIEDDTGVATQGEAYDALMDETRATGAIAKDAGGFAYGAEEIIIRESSQAKLADPVTYDEDGNVIPLSQRFQPASPDIRFAQGPEGIAGYVDLSNFEITLTKKATFSTFIHEMSHIWLELMMQDITNPQAPQSMRNDAQTVLQWFGLKNVDEWKALPQAKRAALHEQWAYNWEDYVTSGKAPSIQLRGIFRMFTRWIKRTWDNVRTKLNAAYRAELRELGQPEQDLPVLTSEVARVMDRLLATDEQIRNNQNFQSAMSLHMTKQQWLDMGNTVDSWNQLIAIQNGVGDDVMEKLLQGTIKGMEWLSSETIGLLKESRERMLKVRSEIEAQLRPQFASMPVYRLRDFLKTGKANGALGEAITVSEPRLNLAMVRASVASPAFLAQVEETLGVGRNGGLFSKGIDPAQVAEMFNYETVQAMLEDLVNKPSLDAAVRTAVDGQMERDHAQLVDRKAIQEQINSALASDLRMRMVAMELQGIDKGLRMEVDATNPDVVKEMADAAALVEKLDSEYDSNKTERKSIRDQTRVLQNKLNAARKRGDTESETSLSIALNDYKRNNSARVRELESQAKSLEKQLRKQRRIAEGPRTKLHTIMAAAKEVAAELFLKTRVLDAMPSYFESATRSQRAATQSAMAKGDTLAAIESKRSELTQAALTREARNFAKEMDSFRAFVREMFTTPQDKIAKNRDYNMAIAARALATVWGLGSDATTDKANVGEYSARQQRALDALDAMKIYAPEHEAKIRQLMNVAMQRAAMVSERAVQQGPAASNSKRNRPKALYKELTVAEFQELMDTIRGTWDTSKAQRIVDLGGRKVTPDEAADELAAEIMKKGPLTAAKAGGQKTSLASKIMNYAALGTRMEHLAEHLDNGKTGPWQEMVYRSVQSKTTMARAEFYEAVTELTDILKDLDMRSGQTVVAKELGGYVFGQGYRDGNPLIAELMHAILHMGNPENFSKMLMGKVRLNDKSQRWGKIDEDGNLDSSDFMAFIERMIEEKILTEEHFNAAVRIFELMDKLTPGLLKASYQVNGFPMKLVKHGEIRVSLGTFRGGYVPAAVDKDASVVATLSELSQSLEQQMSHGLPKVRDGFTKDRQRMAEQPRVMNVNSLASHIRDVLFYTHLQPTLKDLEKVFNRPQLQETMQAYDSNMFSKVMVPWMIRTVRQLSSEPTNNPLDRVIKTIRRRVGLDKMALNLNVAMQQLTGLSVAKTKIPGIYLSKATVQVTKNPREAAREIAKQSPWMDDRIKNKMMEAHQLLDEVIKSPNVYKNFEKWCARNGNVLQAGFQSYVDLVVWTAEYNNALENRYTNLSIEEAQAKAVADADSKVRLTQGGMNPEQLSNVEAGTVWSQLYTQFQNYFILLLNNVGYQGRTLVQELGVKKSIPKLLHLAFFGAYIPLALGQLISETFRGELGRDDDEDGISESWFSVFVMSPVQGTLSGLPYIGPAINFAINRTDDKRYNDQIGSNPTFGAFEAAFDSIGSAYQLVSDPERELRGRDIKDFATTIAMVTGIPVSVLAKPAAYAVEMSRDVAQPSGLIDMSRGLLTGATGSR